MKQVLAVLLGLLCFGQVSVFATVYTVSPGQSIQAKINAAVNGDTVRIQPGTYTENLMLTGKNITLKGMSPLDLAVVKATVIDVSTLPNAMCLYCGTGVNGSTVIEGLTFTGGNRRKAAD